MQQVEGRLREWLDEMPGNAGGQARDNKEGQG